MTRKINWWLTVGGIVLALCGIAILAAPWLFLGFLTVWAGVAFVVSGVTGIGSYIRFRRGSEGAGWSLVMALLDAVVGVLLIVHPFAFAGVIPWVLGVAFIVFGIVEVIGMMPFAKLIPESRIIAIISGVLSCAVGIMFIVWPASISIWIAAFALIRGITLIVMGVTSR